MTIKESAFIKPYLLASFAAFMLTCDFAHAVPHDFAGQNYSNRNLIKYYQVVTKAPKKSPATKPPAKLSFPAQTKPAVTPLIATSTVLLPDVRIGDPAPTFSLLDHQGGSFSSSQEFGQRSLLLIVVGRTLATAGAKSGGDLTRLAREYSDAASQRKEGTLRVVLAVSNATHWNSLPTIPQGLPNLTPVFDANGKLQQIYKVENNQIGLVTIDRAGFIRDQQFFSDFTSLKAHLLSLQDPHSELRVGSIAPDFAIKDAQGRWRRLSDLRGRQNLLLTFFPKCFTGNCTNHLNSLRESYTVLRMAQTEVWAVSVDPAEGERGQLAFKEKLRLQFPLIPDTDRNLCLLYGAVLSQVQLASRMTVLIDKNGTVRLIDKQINLMTHGADMLQKMQELGMTSGS